MTPDRVAVCSWRHLLASRHFPLPFEPVPSAGGLSPPNASFSLPGLSLPTEPSDCPCFTAPCWGHTEEGNCPRRQPRASKRTPPYRRWGTPPQWRLLGPRMSTCGVASRTGAHNTLPPVRSRAQSSLWRAHHVPLLCPWCVCVLCVVVGGCHKGWLVTACYNQCPVPCACRSGREWPHRQATQAVQHRVLCFVGALASVMESLDSSWKWKITVTSLHYPSCCC